MRQLRPLVTCVLFLLLPALLLSRSLAAQNDPAHQARGGAATPGPHYRISYTLDLTHPANHLFGVTLQVAGVAGPVLRFQMPVWYPGRYSVYNFAVNVQNVAAHCDGGAALGVTRLDSTNWQVVTQGCRTVDFTYRVYGNTLTGSFSQLDTTHANLNGGSVLMYVPGHQDDPVSLDVQAPPGWKVLDSLGQLNQTHIEAPNYDILIDSPLEAAPDFSLDTFQSDGRTYRVLIHSYQPLGRYHGKLLGALKKIVAYENTVVAPTDFNTYTFFFHFDPQSPGDGMEHLYGTQIIMPFALDHDNEFAFTEDDAAHEFFHQWNVKRIRPVGLGPFDYTKVPQTPLLWVAEGWTQYYGDITLVRAGLESGTTFLRNLAHTIARFQSQPGRDTMSATESSLTASFHDRSPLYQETNQRATTISYYFKGEFDALALDLDIRNRTHGEKSLNDVLRALWQHNYEGTTDSYYLPGHGYTEQDVENAIEAVAGVSYSDFFRDYVTGVKELPWDQIFAPVGLHLVCQPAPGATSSLGLGLDGVKVNMVVPGSPAEQAAFGIGDQIQQINGQAVTSENFDGLLHTLTPGRPATFIVQRHFQTATLTITPAAPRPSDCTLQDVERVSKQQKQLRKAWLRDAKRD